jgi:hypothetical protein
MGGVGKRERMGGLVGGAVRSDRMGVGGKGWEEWVDGKGWKG